MLSIRRVRADEWEAVRDLRLESLSDPLAPIAFLDTRAGAEARSDDFWRDRTARAAESDDGAQLVAEDDGEWVGSLTVLLRRPGGMDHLHRTASHPGRRRRGRVGATHAPRRRNDRRAARCGGEVGPRARGAGGVARRARRQPSRSERIPTVRVPRDGRSDAERRGERAADDVAARSLRERRRPSLG